MQIPINLRDWNFSTRKVQFQAKRVFLLSRRRDGEHSASVLLGYGASRLRTDVAHPRDINRYRPLAFRCYDGLLAIEQPIPGMAAVAETAFALLPYFEDWLILGYWN
ncbi:MAG: hypothetical protein U1D69_09780 [Polynucleobacter sp.]|nr:hypothetical protein [Polynucleobacter sp.]